MIIDYKESLDEARQKLKRLSALHLNKSDSIQNSTSKSKGDVTDDDAITQLHIPTPEKDNHHVLSVLYDVVMSGELINKLKQIFIDLTSVKRRDAINPMPSSE